MAITRDSYGNVADLTSDHGEADTRMLLHVMYAASPETRIIIYSPDTDVLVLSAAHFACITAKRTVVPHRTKRSNAFCISS